MLAGTRIQLRPAGAATMNAVLRIAAWLIAIALVTLPVVAVLNGWIGGSRFVLRAKVSNELLQLAHAYRFDYGSRIRKYVVHICRRRRHVCE